MAPEVATDGTDSSAVAVETEHLQQTEERATTEAEMQSTDEASIHAKDGLDPAINYGGFHQVVNYKCSIQRELTDHEKHFLFNHHFIPSATYKFPGHTFGKQQRHFQRNWLAKYKV